MACMHTIGSKPLYSYTVTNYITIGGFMQPFHVSQIYMHACSSRYFLQLTNDHMHNPLTLNKAVLCHATVTLSTLWKDFT